MNGFRSQIREEFPHGWWRSWRWWSQGLRELVVWSLATFVPVVLIVSVVKVVRHRTDPAALRRADRMVEAWAAGALTAVFGIVTVARAASLMSPGLVLGVLVLLVVDLALSLLVLVVIVRSRQRRPAAWRDIRPDRPGGARVCGPSVP